jgi:hypothetical protein
MMINLYGIRLRNRIQSKHPAPSTDRQLSLWAYRSYLLSISAIDAKMIAQRLCIVNCVIAALNKNYLGNNPFDRLIQNLIVL